MKRYKLKKDTPMIKAGTIFKAKRNDFGDGTDLIRITPKDHNPDPKWTKEDIKDFDEWFEEVEPEYPFKDGDEYWFINDAGLIRSDCWDEEGYDLSRYERGNVYKTREECDHAIEVQKARVRLQRKANFKPDWNDETQGKYLVYYHYKRDKFYVSDAQFAQDQALVYFSSGGTAAQSIKEDEADWKLVLGVE